MWQKNWGHISQTIIWICTKLHRLISFNICEFYLINENVEKQLLNHLSMLKKVKQITVRCNNLCLFIFEQYSLQEHLNNADDEVK